MSAYVLEVITYAVRCQDCGPGFSRSFNSQEYAKAEAEAHNRDHHEEVGPVEASEPEAEA